MNIKINGGTNCRVYFRRKRAKNTVVKIFAEGLLDRSLALEIISDIKEIREKVSLYVKVPRLIDIEYFVSGSEFSLLSGIEKLNSGIFIHEDYVGISVRDKLRSEPVKSNCQNIINNCAELIRSFPEDLPIDTNPGNFLIDENCKIYFVDFTPPNPWKYLVNKKYTDLVKVFPSIKVRDDDSDKLRRYTTTKGRLERFMYYVSQNTQL